MGSSFSSKLMRNITMLSSHSIPGSGVCHDFPNVVPQLEGHNVSVQALSDGSDFQCSMVMWVPLLIPVYAQSNVPLCFPANATLLENSPPMLVPVYAESDLQTCFTPQVPPYSHPQVLAAENTSPARRQVLTCYTSSGKLIIVWNADAKQLDGNTRSLVSPPFEVPVGLLPKASFKLFIQPCMGRSFAKSKGVGIIKVKCESDLGVSTGDQTLQLGIQVGSDHRGPFSHDFHLHPVGGLPGGHDVWDLRPEVDPVSNTVAITLEIHPASIAKEHGWVATHFDEH